MEKYLCRGAKVLLSHSLACATTVAPATFLVALDKPAGVLSHPNPNSASPPSASAATGAKGSVLNADKRALLTLPYDCKREAYVTDDGTGSIFLLNRLDSATSGVILLASDEGVARDIKEQFRQRLVKKTYIAKCFGRWVPPKGGGPRSGDANRAKGGTTIWQHHINVHSVNGHVRAKVASSSRSSSQSMDLTKVGSSIGNARVAETHASLISPRSGGRNTSSGLQTCLLELRPLTGYTHQLRYQCAASNLPIIGDKVYGNYDMNKRYVQALGETTGGAGQKARLMLHSTSIELNYVWDRRMIPFHAVSPPPLDFT
jgi:tRNA pseudouridine65 synthase